MILVDPRVGSAHLAPALTALGCPADLTHLAFGDCAFLGNGPDGPVQVGIELKNLADLVNSMQSGRLAGHQIPGLVETYPYRWLLVEGIVRPRRQDGLAETPRGARWVPVAYGRRPIFWRDLQKYLTTIEVQAGVHVRWTRSPGETVQVIAELYHWWSKAWDQHGALHAIAKAEPPGVQLAREDETTRRLRQVAACLPKVGWGRSRAVAQAFRSIAGLVAAPVEAWRSIEGIGPAIAKDVTEAIHAEIPSAPRQAGGVPAGGRASAGRARHSRPRARARVGAGTGPQ